MKKLGILTIGQSPRPDILRELLPFFGSDVELIEAGALDGRTIEEIETLAPGPGDRLLVTRLSDGSVVHVAEESLTACIQEKIGQLEEKGAACIFILCTARFQGLSSNVPLVEPGSVLNRVVPQLAPNSAIGVLSPEAEQVEATKRDWKGIVERIQILTASPYGTEAELELVSHQFGQMDIDLIVLDCMGYSEKQRERIEVVSGKTVILSKTLAAKFAVEILKTALEE